MTDWSASTDSIGHSVLDAIGNTPLVRLDRLWNGKGQILAKLDYLNPGGSKKDRIALQIIDEAEARGDLSPGQTVVELTSGNTGTGLAIVCAVKGYPFVAVMSRGNSAERAQMMRALGAEVVLVDQTGEAHTGHVTGEDLSVVEAVAQHETISRSAFRADQFRSAGNANAHAATTGPELWTQSGGTIDVFCEFAGTGGTFAGVSGYLKEKNPAVICYLIEPRGAAALSGKPVTNPYHRIQGGGYGMAELPMVDSGVIDGIIEVTDEQAMDATRRLAKQEGIFAGVSSGACVAVAEMLLETRHLGATTAVVLADSGLKYLSTDLWANPASHNSTPN
jgi:cysteine synthase A